MQTLRSGELARRANVNVETLRFYERQGLLSKPPQRASGYREYPPEAVDLVQFIKRAQALGFSLREIKELLALREVPRATCGDVVVLARRKIEGIDSTISDLRAMRAALTALLKECTGTAPIAQCPIIESLVDEAKPKEKSRLCTGKVKEKRNGKRREPNCCG
jgi:Hg(II)-responsive transcriptional regulator